MYKYRVLKSSWRIAIDIDFSIQEYINCAENIFFYDKKNISNQYKIIISLEELIVNSTEPWSK